MTKQDSERRPEYRVVEADTPGDAWRAQMALVLERGRTVRDGDVELREVLNVLCVVERPTERDPIVERFGDPEMIAFMQRNFNETEVIPSFGYSYGQRMRDYDGVNQLERVVELLRQKPDSKSATITLGRPGHDDRHHPCINVLDFKLRDGQLQLACFFRSQDAGSKLYADILALGDLLHDVARRVGCPPGRLLIFVVSSHIYETDESRVREILAACETRDD